jgi:hypothetical protein
MEGPKMNTTPLRIGALGLLTVAGMRLDAPVWAVGVSGAACVALLATRTLPVKPARPGRQPMETQEENHAWTR